MKLQATCHDLLQHWDALWTFSRMARLHPTNNLAERALRGAVIWRKRCYGTQRALGSRFVEWMLSVRATCARQGRNLFGYCRISVLANRTQTIQSEARVSVVATPSTEPQTVGVVCDAPCSWASIVITITDLIPVLATQAEEASLDCSCFPRFSFQRTCVLPSKTGEWTFSPVYYLPSDCSLSRLARYLNSTR
jgi:hypothetical protein